MENTINAPLRLSYHEGKYTVNKSGYQDGAYVDHDIALNLLKALEILIDPNSGDFWSKFKTLKAKERKQIMMAYKKAKGL